MKEEMTVYNKKAECCGCRACEQSCPTGCIRMEMDEEGFTYPVIDREKCIDCGICHKVCENLCAAKEHGQQIKTQTYAVKNKDFEIRKMSSSGGVFFELAKEIIGRGGNVFGAVFDADFKVVHVGTDESDMLKSMCGSKYVQSDTGKTYTEVWDLLRDGKWVLYSGTPCQIAGLKSFLKEGYEKLICVSVICHGVPSPQIWEAYLETKQKDHQGKKIEAIEFRNKVNGWQNFTFMAVFAPDDVEQTAFRSDLYMQGFLQNLYLRPSCYECRAKVGRQDADIILGDYWGISTYHRDFCDDMGVSAVIINTDKGMHVWDAVKDKFDIEITKLDYIVQGNMTFHKSVSKNPRRDKFFYDFNEIKGQSISTSILNNLKKPIDEKEVAWYQYPTILKYLRNRLRGYETNYFFRKMGWHKVALYAINELTELLYLDITNSNSDVEITCICDKQYTAFVNGYQGNSVIGVEELSRRYQNGEIDCIVVGSVIHENNIIQELAMKGCDLDRVLSINSVIYGCED